MTLSLKLQKKKRQLTKKNNKNLEHMTINSGDF